MENNQTEIDSLKSEIVTLRTLVSNLQALFKATVGGKSSAIHHLASAASGFWEIIQPTDTIRYIDHAEKLVDGPKERSNELQTFQEHLTTSDRIRLRNQLSNMKLAPQAFFEFSYVKDSKLRRLQGKAVEWDHNGEASKLIGIYVELPTGSDNLGHSTHTIKRCANCGKFESSALEWNLLEDYIEKRFDQKISQCTCPTCAELTQRD